jgi:hypothetical protein
MSFRDQLRLPFFMEIRNLQASIQRCKDVFKGEFALVILRAKTKFHPLVDLWLETYV